MHFPQISTKIFLLKIGILSAKGIRKTRLYLEVCCLVPAPPSTPSIKLVFAVFCRTLRPFNSHINASIINIGMEIKDSLGNIYRFSFDNHFMA